MSKSPLGERERIARIIDPYLPWDQPVEAYGWARELRREEAFAKADLILSAQVPPGWKLVPVEPTEEMRDAGYLAATIDFDVLSPDCAKPVWAAMLAAALLPEEGQGLSPSQSQPVSDALRATTSGAGPSALLSFEAQLQERLADPEWVAKWATLEGDERPFVEMLLALRKDEGNSVTLLSDNPDFNGQPSNAIECCGAWTGWKDRRFTGDTLRAAVLAAYKALSTPPATPALGLIEGEQGSSNAISGPTPKSADTTAEPSAEGES